MKGKVARSVIRKYANQIAKQFHPNKIILFGSYAYGKPTEDSDVDILVIMPFKGRNPEKPPKFGWQPGLNFGLILWSANLKK